MLVFLVINVNKSLFYSKYSSFQVGFFNTFRLYLFVIIIVIFVFTITNILINIIANLIV